MQHYGDKSATVRTNLHYICVVALRNQTSEVKQCQFVVYYYHHLLCARVLSPVRTHGT